MLSIIFLFVVALFTFTYHYERNGNPVPLGDTVQRLAWGFAFGAGYMMLTFLHTNPFIFAYYVVGAFISILAIPHAYAQNAGHRTQTWLSMPPIPVFGSLTLPKYWPAYPLRNMTNFALQDFLGMMCEGVLTGLIIFIPPIWFGASMTGSVAAAAFTTIWDAFAYWLGYKVPWTIWTNTARSSTWGEFFVPIGRAIALLMSVLM